MSICDDESLEFVMRELKAKLPELQRLLQRGVHVETLHGTVEMLTILVGSTMPALSSRNDPRSFKSQDRARSNRALLPCCWECRDARP